MRRRFSVAWLNWLDWATCVAKLCGPSMSRSFKASSGSFFVKQSEPSGQPARLITVLHPAWSFGRGFLEASRLFARSLQLLIDPHVVDLKALRKDSVVNPPLAAPRTAN